MVATRTVDVDVQWHTMAGKIKAQVGGVTTMGSFTLFTLEIHGITSFSYFLQKQGNNYHNAHL